jgi:hypothetical protein
MDRAGHRLGGSFRLRNILPKSKPSEDSSKNAESHGVVTISTQHGVTNARQSVLQEEAGVTFVDDHSAKGNLYANNFLPNIEQDYVSGWAVHLPPGLGVQVERRNPFQYVRNIGMDPNGSLYEGMMQAPVGENIFASPQHTLVRPPFAQNKDVFPLCNTYGGFDDPQGYPNFISRTGDVPLQSDQFWGNSLTLVDSSPEVFGTETSSFLGQTMSCGSAHLLKGVNAAQDLLDFSGSHAYEYWQSFPSEDVEANANTLGAPLENRPADDDMDDFSMFFDTSTPTTRLGPNLAAVLLGIPEDPGRATGNEVLPFSYEPRSSPNNG